MTLSIARVAIGSLATALLLSLSLFATTVAQVATLAEPDAEPEATPVAAAEDLEGEEALLEFAACMRDSGIDMDDPQFGVSGGRFGFGPGGEDVPAFDLQSSEFQNAMETCGSFLESMRPDLDPEEEAERAEERLEMAQCMRDRGWDFPDPDPGSGFGPRMLEGGLDFGDPALREDITACQSDLGIEVGGPGGPPPA